MNMGRFAIAPVVASPTHLSLKFYRLRCPTVCMNDKGRPSGRVTDIFDRYLDTVRLPGLLSGRENSHYCNVCVILEVDNGGRRISE